MEEQSIFEKHQIRAREIFEQATFEEFFGNHLFEYREQNYYIFAPGESGNAVWLNRNLEPMQIDEAKKPQVVPDLHPFNHCEPLDLTLFEDKRISDIEAKIRHGGKLLGQKANKAFIDVLSAAISDKNRVKASDQKLDELLADVFSQLVSNGFRPDRFIFPQHLEAKLVQLEIITRDRLWCINIFSSEKRLVAFKNSYGRDKTIFCKKSSSR